jgi:UDP-N-acetylmuramoylalanine--D-glutamate ligase
MAEYIIAKENLLKNAKHIVLNYDDLILRNLGKRYKELGRSVEFFSLKEKADAYLDNGYLYLKGIKLFHRDKIKLAGDFNISNALASILATYKHVSIDEICHGAISFNGVKNRLEFIRELKGIKFYNSSIDSTPSRTIASLSAFDINRCIVILGGRDKNLSYDILKNHLKNAKAIIIMGENREKILNALCSGKTILVNNMAEAVSIAYSLAHIGDNIILSPASTSFDMYENYIERGKDFIKSVNNLK